MLTNAEKPTKEEAELLKVPTPPPDGYKGKTYAPIEPVKTGEKTDEKPKEDKSAEGSKPAVPAADKPKSEDAEKKADKPAPQEDSLLKLERELQKPVGQEKLDDFTPRERAYFYTMRKERKLRQDAESERDAIKRQQVLKKKDEPDEDPVEKLKKRDPSEFMTVGEAVKLVEGRAKAADKDAGPDPVMRRLLIMSDKEARAAHPEDYDIVMELAEDLISKNQDHLLSIAEAIHAGDNPAEVTYALIKSDPEFSKLYPVAETRVAARKLGKDSSKPPAKEEPIKKEEPAKEEVSEEARRAQEAIEKNTNKPKTTGHVGSVEDKPAGEHTLEDIAKMPDREYRQLPKKERERFLREFGGGPALITG